MFRACPKLHYELWLLLAVYRITSFNNTRWCLIPRVQCLIFFQQYKPMRLHFENCHDNVHINTGVYFVLFHPTAKITIYYIASKVISRVSVEDKRCASVSHWSHSHLYCLWMECRQNEYCLFVHYAAIGDFTKYALSLSVSLELYT